MERIKILMVLDNTGRGGSQSFVMNVCRYIDWNQFQIDITITRNKRGGYDEEMARLGCRIHNLEHFNLFNYRRYVACWHRFLSENRYDIVHGNVSGPASIYLRIARRHGCATILHSHSSGHRGNLLERLVKRCLSAGAKRYADLWFACSPKAAIRLFGKDYATDGRYHYIPNAIDVSRYRFDESIRCLMRNQHGITDGTFVCGHVGSFSRPKNHAFLLQVFSQLHGMKPDSRLLLVGDGYLRDEVTAMIERLGLRDFVIMTGNINNVNEYLMAMDVMVFPSLFEGFPVSLLESQASGLNSVVSESITSEIALSDLVHFKSLQASPKDWAQAALCCHESDRASYNAVIADTQYNMVMSISDLERLYISLAK